MRETMCECTSVISFFYQNIGFLRSRSHRIIKAGEPRKCFSSLHMLYYDNGIATQVFRTQQTDVLQDPDAARFFAEPRPLAPKVAADAAVFDLSVIHAALPTPAAQASQQQQQQQHNLSAAWAADFMNQQGPQNQRRPNSSESLTFDTINRHASPAVIPHGVISF